MKRRGKFEYEIQRFNLLGGKVGEPKKDTITVLEGETDIQPLEPYWQNNRLIIHQYEDGRSRAEIDYVPTDDNLLDDFLFKTKLNLHHAYRIESASNINFPCPDLTTVLEMPLVEGRIEVKIRRLT